MQQDKAADFESEAHLNTDSDMEAVEADADVAASTRVLLLTDGSPAVSGAVEQISAHLVDAGYHLEVMPDNDWHKVAVDEMPTIILLYSGGSHGAAVKMCWQLKSAGDIGSSAVVAVRPLEDKGHERRATIWRDLRATGADSVLSLRCTAAEVAAHVELVARIVHLQLELAAAREELTRASQLDRVTKLLNRRSFFQAAHRECSRARRYRHPLACLMIGVNYFEHYNKTFGEACGDYLLGAVADALRETTRDTDIAARFSDKRMVVLLPETDIAGAALAREKLERAVVSTTFLWQQQQLPVSISVGEAERQVDEGSGEAGSTPDADEEELAVSMRVELADLLEDADAALAVARKGAHCPGIFVEDDLRTISLAEADAQI